LPKTTRFPVLSSSRPSSLDLRPPRIDMSRRVSGPPRPTSGFRLTCQQYKHTHHQRYQLAAPTHLFFSSQVMPCAIVYHMLKFQLQLQSC
jgi:hypothetical protein